MIDEGKDWGNRPDPAWLQQRVTTLEAELKGLQGQSKQLRVIGYGFIPWSIAERAWEIYAKHHGGRDQPLEVVARRGGFHAEEMDLFLPGWREEASEIARLAAENDQLRKRITFWEEMYSEKAIAKNQLTALLLEAKEAMDMAIYDLERFRDAQGARSGSHVANEARKKIWGET